MDYGRFLVISLGTGASKEEEKYSAEKARKWGILGWITSKDSTPLIDSFIQASGDMVDIHISVVFQALRSGSKNLRIQDDTLRGAVSSTDISTKENLENLLSVGKGLLKKPVSMVNLSTGKYEAMKDEGTNEETLTRFAKLLSQERKLRETRSRHKRHSMSN